MALRGNNIVGFPCTKNSKKLPKPPDTSPDRWESHKIPPQTPPQTGGNPKKDLLRHLLRQMGIPKRPPRKTSPDRWESHKIPPRHLPRQVGIPKKTTPKPPLTDGNPKKYLQTPPQTGGNPKLTQKGFPWAIVII